MHDAEPGAINIERNSPQTPSVKVLDSWARIFVHKIFFSQIFFYFFK